MKTAGTMRDPCPQCGGTVVFMEEWKGIETDPTCVEAQPTYSYIAQARCTNCSWPAIDLSATVEIVP